MVSVIQEKEEGKGKGLEELSRHHYNYKNYLQMESSAYSLFVPSHEVSPDKAECLQRLGYFLDFVQITTRKADSIEERCNKLAELAKRDRKWLVNCIFNYLQLLKTRR